MKRWLILGTVALAATAGAQESSVGRTQRQGKLATTELQPPAPVAKAPAPVAFEPVPTQLTGLKWRGNAYFEDAEGRRWRRVGGTVTQPWPSALAGSLLALNDGSSYFYADNGQLFVLCL